MFRRLAAVILSVVLLSPGWLGMTGLTLPFAMIPLLWISASYDQTRRSWWRMFGWAALTFALWNISTVWWIWNATPVGPVASSLNERLNEEVVRDLGSRRRTSFLSDLGQAVSMEIRN